MRARTVRILEAATQPRVQTVRRRQLEQAEDAVARLLAALPPEVPRPRGSIVCAPHVRAVLIERGMDPSLFADPPAMEDE